MFVDYGQMWFHTLDQFETNRSFALTRNPEFESIAAGPGIFNVGIVRSIPTVRLPLTKALIASSSLSPSPNPKQTGDQVRGLQGQTQKANKWRPLLPRAPKRVAEMVVSLAHP